MTSITKLSRREGYALHPKAHKILVKRTTPPGQQGHSRRTKASQYSLQLREKQKVKRLYGLAERPFAKLMQEASRTKGQSGQVLLQLLEQRADNVVYRAGFARSRQAARQLVVHGHFQIDGKRLTVPSHRLEPGVSLNVRTASRKNQYFSHLDEVVGDQAAQSLSWLKADPKKFSINVTALPQRDEAEPDINEQLIVEYYSR